MNKEMQGVIEKTNSRICSAYLKIAALEEQKKHYRLAALKAVNGDKARLKQLLDETVDLL